MADWATTPPRRDERSPERGKRCLTGTAGAR